MAIRKPKIGQIVYSWAGRGKIDFIRGDKVKLKLDTGGRSKFLNLSGLTRRKK
jgi:hypothetical protein